VEDLREFKRIMLLQYEALTRQTASSLEYLKTAETAMAATTGTEEAAAAAAAAAKECTDTVSHAHRSWDTLEDDTVEAMAENVERRLAVNAGGGAPPPLKLRPLMLREVRESRPHMLVFLRPSNMRRAQSLANKAADTTGVEDHSSEEASWGQERIVTFVFGSFQSLCSLPL